MLPEEIVTKKAELINYGMIRIPPEITLPYYPSRSSAGPGAGSRAMVFSFSGTRIKLGIVRDKPAIYTLALKDNRYYNILKHGEPYLDNVTIEPTVMHAPGQAFINITNECIYNCSFCVTPNLDRDDRHKKCTVERWGELILAQANNRNLECVAITSGVKVSPHKTVLDMVNIIKTVRTQLPEIPIGVEPYLTAQEDIDILFEAGATEIKLNLETPTRELFSKVCQGMDYDGIKHALKYAVAHFGPNRVCSNIIIGLGETDEEVLTAVEDLAKDGVVATLRALRINEINMPKLKDALGFEPGPVEPERLLNLARKHKEILDKYDLSTLEFQTMCHKCKSCDIVPQQDL